MELSGAATHAYQSYNLELLVTWEVLDWCDYWPSCILHGQVQQLQMEDARASTESFRECVKDKLNA
eukprot:6286510-Amphidinium_carterae.1